MKTVILIPAYNPGNKLAGILQSLARTHPDVPVVVVDDGSQPALAVQDNQSMLLVRHPYNRGKGAAIRTGLKTIEHHFKNEPPDAVLFMDADGQHAPTSINEFIAAYEQGRGEIIIGKRNLNPSSMPFMRVLSNRITSRLLSWKTGVPLADCQCGYRLIAWQLIRRVLPLQTSGYETETELLIKILRYSANVHHIPIETIYADEVSHIRGVRDIRAFVKLFFTLK